MSEHGKKIKTMAQTSHSADHDEPSSVSSFSKDENFLNERLDDNCTVLHGNSYNNTIFINIV